MNKKLVCVAKVTSAHGIKGAVKIKSFTQDPLSIEEYPVLYSKDGLVEFKLKITSCNRDMLIAFIDGVSDRNEAEKLKNKELYVYRNDFEEVDEDEFYYEDLVGLRVKLKNGVEYGQIVSMQNYGAGDIVEIKLKNSKNKELYSFVEEVFPNVNIKSGSILFIPPETKRIDE